MTPNLYEKGCSRRDFVLWTAVFAAVPSFAAAPDARFDAKDVWNSFVKAYWMDEKAQFRKHKGKDDVLYYVFLK